MFTVGSVFPAAVRAGKPDRLGRFAAAVQGAVIAECRAAKAAHDVHEIGHIVVHKNDVIHLLAEVQRRHQQHGDRDAAGESRQRRQHDEHEHDAGRAQQPRARELHTAARR